MPDPLLQEQIDEVRAGRSTTLRLGRPFAKDLTDVPEQIRELTGLRTLELRSPAMKRLPSWLDELPSLEEIDVSRVEPSALPSFLPRVRWGVNPEQILSFGDQLDQGQISAILIHDDSSRSGIQHMFDLGRSNALELSRLVVTAGVRVSRDVTAAEQQRKWQFFDVIDSQLDEFLNGSKLLRELDLFGFPIGRVPEPVRNLRALTKISLAAVWPAVIPDWLFEVPELTWLHLGYNGIYSLPEALGEASRLQYLDLKYNNLRRISDEVWKLAKLETLVLDGCPIEEIPVGILRLERLSDLMLSRTEGVPKELVMPTTGTRTTI